MAKLKAGCTEFSADFSFLLFNSLIFLLRDTGVILSFYGVCLIHELGHITALIINGGKLRSVVFSGFGIKMQSEGAYSIKAEALILAAGPAVNLITWLVLSLTGHNGYFSQLSLAEGIFNLLPFGFLDGGAMAELFITGSHYEKEAAAVLSGLRILTVTAAVVILLKIVHLI